MSRGLGQDKGISRGPFQPQPLCDSVHSPLSGPPAPPAAGAPGCCFPNTAPQHSSGKRSRTEALCSPCYGHHGRRWWGPQGPLGREGASSPLLCRAPTGPLLPVGLSCPGASATPPAVSPSRPWRSQCPRPWDPLPFGPPPAPAAHASSPPGPASTQPTAFPPPFAATHRTPAAPSPGRWLRGPWGSSALTLLSPVRGLPLHGGHRTGR